MIALIEVLNSLSVLFLNLGLCHHILVLEVLGNFLAFDAHNAHKMVCRVGKLRASVFVAEGSEVVDCQPSFIEVDDLALGEEHKAVENFVDVGVWLMDGADNSSSAVRQLPKGLNHRCGCK